VVQNVRRMAVEVTWCYVPTLIIGDFRLSVETVMTNAVNDAILCRRIQNCNRDSCGDRLPHEIKWHPVSQKIDAVENGTFVRGASSELE
jgi:hypothetical protein